MTSVYAFPQIHRHASNEKSPFLRTETFPALHAPLTLSSWPQPTEKSSSLSPHYSYDASAQLRSPFVCPPLPLPTLPSQPPRVLFAEDNEAVRSLTTRYLQHHGFEVFACADGLEAHRWFVEHGRCDLLLTDIQMPKLDGLRLARLVRETHPALPVLFVSGFSTEPIKLDDFLSGPTIFLPKPYPLPQLVETLRRLQTLSSETARARA